MLAYPAATFDKLTSGTAGNARAIVFNPPTISCLTILISSAFLHEICIDVYGDSLKR
jgi:hypothetical protein